MYSDTDFKGQRLQNGPILLKSTGRHGHLLNSTCDIGLIDMYQVLKNIVTLTCEMGENKRQGHATLPFF